MIAFYLPDAISSDTSRILVKPTLQVLTDKPTVFALGDVAEHGGPRMARAGWMQAEVVADNILAVIRGQEPPAIYKPSMFIEGSIKLTLGKTHTVIYAMDPVDESEILITTDRGPLDMGVRRAWWQYGADFTSCQAQASAVTEQSAP